MKLILSPTKTMDFNLKKHGTANESGMGLPQFDREAGKLNQTLKSLDLAGMKKLFKTSDALTQKTHDQIHGFETAETGPALFVFQGEAFKTLCPMDFTQNQMDFAQAHLRIFSGLYGVLAPLDLIKPYRLDFNTPLAVDNMGLKKFWQKKIIPYFESLVEPDEPIINLASDEYSKTLSSPGLKERLITLQFREKSGNKLKNISVRAKQARGFFARKIIQDKIYQPDDIKHLCVEGYTYSQTGSTSAEWFFIR